MVSCNVINPYNYCGQMTARQLEYVVFVLIEKYREDNHTDIVPNWWPKNIVYCHPMVRDPNVMDINEWKNCLTDIIENYYKLNTESWWFQDLLKKTLSDDENKYVHLITDTYIEDQKIKLEKLVENKINNDIKSEQKEKNNYVSGKLRIKESALLQLLPQPVILLYDVIKYGLETNKENFLNKLNLIKIDKIIVNKARYKLRRNDTNKFASPSVPPNQKPKLITTKKQEIKPCFVQLNKISKTNNNNNNKDINLPSNNSVTATPPFLILKPLDFTPKMKLESPKNTKLKKQKRKSDSALLNFTKPKKLYSSVKKTLFKNKNVKKNIIKIKWMAKPRISI